MAELAVEVGAGFYAGPNDWDSFVFEDFPGAVGGTFALVPDGGQYGVVFAFWNDVDDFPGLCHIRVGAGGGNDDEV